MADEPRTLVYPLSALLGFHCREEYRDLSRRNNQLELRIEAEDFETYLLGIRSIPEFEDQVTRNHHALEAYSQEWKEIKNG